VSVSPKGIAAVKAAGTYQGRAASNAIRLREMKAQAFGAGAVARALGIGRASVYRLLELN
jgi:DNA invertase Pin-like site-specific DNA recombinase